MNLREYHQATLDWANTTLEFYGENMTQSARNGIIFKGPFAGWSLGAVIDLAKGLKNNAEKYPLPQIEGK